MELIFSLFPKEEKYLSLFLIGGLLMKLLEDRILKDGVIFPGNVLKVDSFLNHRIDVPFISELGREFYRLFEKDGVNKIVTIEASGIGVACLTAAHFHCPVVFAKKSETSNTSPDVYTAPVHSYTHNKDYTVRIAKDYLSADDRILLIDDFLATGEALDGLLKLANDAGATVCGAGIVIEKAFQPGGDELRSKGIRVESLARIASMTDHGITFAD